MSLTAKACFVQYMQQFLEGSECPLSVLKVLVCVEYQLKGIYGSSLEYRWQDDPCEVNREICIREEGMCDCSQCISIFEHLSGYV